MAHILVAAGIENHSLTLHLLAVGIVLWEARTSLLGLLGLAEAAEDFLPLFSLDGIELQRRYKCLEELLHADAFVPNAHETLVALREHAAAVLEVHLQRPIIYLAAGVHLVTDRVAMIPLKKARERVSRGPGEGAQAVEHGLLEISLVLILEPAGLQEGHMTPALDVALSKLAHVDEGIPLVGAWARRRRSSCHRGHVTAGR
mmetsp:Transcript_67798/g.145123  ORF Transcript_67798/g.145123 Transcript_67798/m.145123 type:complete len:202 (-) Transcript_67798:1462-2067(-)